MKKIIHTCTNQTGRNYYFLYFFILISISFIVGCAAQYPLNIKTEIAGKSFIRETASKNKDSDLILILAFSGGGTRAASMAYGTLEALKQVEIPSGNVSPNNGQKQNTFLNNVSIITAVSGGSFTAAYYGLHGEGIFKDFRERCLLKDMQGDLLYKLINPFNWPRLGSPRFGRSDLAQEYYDKILFNGATLADMTADDRPSIVIMATDSLGGLSFPFIPDAFTWICSDFNRFPVSRAVTASSAVPGIFSPIVLINYTNNCRKEVPAWIKDALKKPDQSSRKYHMAVSANSYLNQNKKPFLYLIDGGITDNLGLRTIIDIVTLGGLKDILAKSERKEIRRVAFIIVDAETQTEPAWGILGEIPGTGTVLDIASTIMINKYNFETIDLLRRSVRDWQTELALNTNPVDFYVIHMTFKSLADKKEQEYFQNIPTSLSLSADQVDKLRNVAARLIYSSPEFQKLVRDTGGKIIKPTANNIP